MKDGGCPSDNKVLSHQPCCSLARGDDGLDFLLEGHRVEEEDLLELLLSDLVGVLPEEVDDATFTSTAVTADAAMRSLVASSSLRFLLKLEGAGAKLQETVSEFELGDLLRHGLQPAREVMALDIGAYQVLIEPCRYLGSCLLLRISTSVHTSIYISIAL